MIPFIIYTNKVIISFFNNLTSPHIYKDLFSSRFFYKVLILYLLQFNSLATALSLNPYSFNLLT